MSALGHKQTFAAQNSMSALPPIATAKSGLPKQSCPLYPPKADMCGATVHVRYGPEADITRSFDHLVGARKHGGRHGEAERFGGLKVDDQFKFGRSLYGHIAWLLTLENTINVFRRSSE